MATPNDRGTPARETLLQLPERPTLVDQVVKTIIQGIQPGGQWSSQLPGERPLAEYLQISRSTLRKAFKILKREGVIQIMHGQNAKVSTKRISADKTTRHKLVAVVLSKPLHEHSGHTMLIISEIQRALAQQGFEIVPISARHLYCRQPASFLERLARTTSACCWVLVGPSLEMASWFKKRHLPVIVIGTCADIGLPSFDRHRGEIARHAGGLLLGLGHQKIVLLLLKSNESGEKEIHAGFLQAFRSGDHAGAAPLVMRVQKRPDAVWAAMDKISQMNPRPTALVTAVARHGVAAISRLARLGLRVPEDISVICLGDDPFLDYINPKITHYTTNKLVESQRIARAVRQIAEGGNLPLRRNLIWPTLIRGNSVLAPPRRTR